MEAVVLVGLLGAGYMYNSKNEDNNPIDTPVNKEINMPSGNNVYDSNHYNESEKLVRSLAENNFEESQNDHSKVINSQNLYKPTDNIPNVNEPYGNYVYSSAAGGLMSNDNFLSNDQGITPSPYFSKAPANVNYDDNRDLSRTQGGNDFYKSKQETPNFFSPEKDGGNVFGTTFGEYIGDQSRYEAGLRRTNELPFAQERVSPIDVKSDFNREIDQMIAQKNGIDNLRTANNPKLNYEGKILSGKGIEHRGKEGQVFQHHPDKFYSNDPDKWFVTNGAFLAKSERPTQVMPDTYRRHFNKQELGPAAPAVHEGSEERPSFKKSLKRQFGTDTVRNIGVENSSVGTDFHKQGYRALPNEREVTELRTYDSNLRAEFNEPTMGIQDPLKKTVKETTIDSKNNGYVQNTLINNTLGLQDNLKVTKKQTTIDSKNNGYIMGGFEKSTSGYETPENTTKDTTLFDYTGNAGAYVKGDMNQTNFMNAETNPTKEIIAQGRHPTINNTKISNGMDTVTMETKKMDIDYMSHRLNGVDKVYQEIPTDNNCQITTMKDRLEDNSISDRIDPNLLNPFRQNPYTQPLESFAY